MAAEAPTATQTTTPTPLKVARAIFDALAKKDLAAAFEFLSAETVDDFVAIGQFRGAPAIRRFFDELLTAFPDFEITVDRIVADRSTAVVQWHAAGSFTGGMFQGIEPTGKHIEIRGVDIMDITEGKVVHNTIYYDGASFARQIGLLPRVDSGTDKGIRVVFNSVHRLRRRFR